MTKQEPSLGTNRLVTFDSVILHCGDREVSILDNDFHLSDRGVTFKMSTYLAPFTSLNVRLKLPVIVRSAAEQIIDCDGVVVECRGSHRRKIYHVTVAFLNLTDPGGKRLSIGEWVPPAPKRRPDTQDPQLWPFSR